MTIATKWIGAALFIAATGLGAYLVNSAGDPVCQTGTAMVDADGMAALKLTKRKDDGRRYIYCRFRACAADKKNRPVIPQGVNPLPTSLLESPRESGDKDFTAWCNGGDSTMPCACGPGCDWRREPKGPWEPGMRGMVYQAGNWRATDAGVCIRTTCMELAGFPSLPSECE